MNIARSFAALAMPLSDRRLCGRPDRPDSSDAHSMAAGGSPSHGAHVDYRSIRRRARLRGWKLPITDGPFAESKEL